VFAHPARGFALRVAQVPSPGRPGFGGLGGWLPLVNGGRHPFSDPRATIVAARTRRRTDMGNDVDIAGRGCRPTGLCGMTHRTRANRRAWYPVIAG